MDESVEIFLYPVLLGICDSRTRRMSMSFLHFLKKIRAVIFYYFQKSKYGHYSFVDRKLERTTYSLIL